MARPGSPRRGRSRLSRQRAGASRCASPPSRPSPATRATSSTCCAQLTEVYPPRCSPSEGLRIYSTLDRRLQRVRGPRPARRHSSEIEKRTPGASRERGSRARLQGCLMAMRPQTGELLALVGRARLPGLPVRPLHPGAPPVGQRLQALRLHRRRSSPSDGRTSSSPWRAFSTTPARDRHAQTDPGAPELTTIEFHEIVSVREALEGSYNVATARLAQEIGMPARRCAGGAPTRDREPTARGAEPGAGHRRGRAARDRARLRDTRERRRASRTDSRAIEDVVDQGGEVLERRRAALSSACSTPAPPTSPPALLEGVAERGTAASVRCRRAPRSRLRPRPARPTRNAISGSSATRPTWSRWYG